MSPEEYWNGSAELTKAYEKAYRLRQEERNYEFWLQGLYFYHALNTTLHNMFSNDTPLEYISEPIKIFQTEEDRERERLEKEAAELEATLNAFAKRVNNGSST